MQAWVFPISQRHIYWGKNCVNKFWLQNPLYNFNLSILNSFFALLSSLEPQFQLH